MQMCIQECNDSGSLRTEFFKRNDFELRGGNGQYEGAYRPHPQRTSSPNLLYITEGRLAHACCGTFGFSHVDFWASPWQYMRDKDRSFSASLFRQSSQVSPVNAIRDQFELMLHVLRLFDFS